MLEKVFCDAALTNQTALTRHASALQMALQSACNIGMNSCSRILEWVEAAVVYEKKGAVGLLKHAAALIGPQNTSAIVHVDGSMDDDANNRGPGAELPNSHSKGMMNALIQDSAVHALTISLKLLAPSAQNMVKISVGGRSLLFLHNNSISFGPSLQLICGLRYCSILVLMTGHCCISLWGGCHGCCDCHT